MITANKLQLNYSILWLAMINRKIKKNVFTSAMVIDVKLETIWNVYQCPSMCVCWSVLDFKQYLRLLSSLHRREREIKFQWQFSCCRAQSYTLFSVQHTLNYRKSSHWDTWESCVKTTETNLRIRGIKRR